MPVLIAMALEKLLFITGLNLLRGQEFGGIISSFINMMGIKLSPF
jgi:hypothetical protein